MKRSNHIVPLKKETAVEKIKLRVRKAKEIEESPIVVSKELMSIQTKH